MNNQWKLKSLNINLCGYGEFKGQYTGKIAFENGSDEGFVFNMPPESITPYVNLIASDVVASANILGEKLLQSLNILQLPVNEAAQ